MHIRYFGDIKWFSERNTKPSYGSVWKALNSHISYIKSPKRKDLQYTENLDKETWKKITLEETSKRWDSRIAGKLTLALPNSLDIDSAKALIKEFITKEINPNYFGFALHRPKGALSKEKENFHAHVLFSARSKDGKKLRINPKKLRELHKKWDQYIEKYSGQKPFKAPQKMEVKVRPYHVRPDSPLYDPTRVEYIRTRRRAWTYIKEAYQIEREKKQTVSLQAERPLRSPVMGKPITAEPAEPVRRQTLPLSVQLDGPFLTLEDFSPERTLGLRDRILLLEEERRHLEWELKSTSWLNFPKKVALQKKKKAIEREISALERREEKVKKFDEMTRNWLREFINMLYHRPDVDPNSHQIAILAVSHEPESRMQFLIRIADIERKLPYLRKLNTEGYNVYASINVLCPTAERRRAEDFLPFQVAVYIDLDSKQKSAATLWREIWEEIRDRRLPEPSYVVKSSKGNYQVYWIAREPIEVWKLQAIMKGLNQRFGLDSTQDVARVFRIPGLRNRKPGKQDLVQPVAGDVIWVNKDQGQKVKVTKQKYPKDVFEILFQVWGQPIERPTERTERKEYVIKPSPDPSLEELYRNFYKRKSQYKSLSEMDMAFTIRALSLGFKPEKVASFLALQRADKVNPGYYAQITIKKGMAYLRRKQEAQKVKLKLSGPPEVQVQSPKV